MEQYGYPGLFFLIFLENVFPPIPSEVILPFGGFLTIHTSLHIPGVVFFATFVLCRVVIAFLVTVLTNINKIPLLGGVNRILGVCIGVVAGFINVLLILCLLWAVVVITNGNLPFANDSSLSGSCFYSFFSAYNPFL